MRWKKNWFRLEEDTPFVFVDDIKIDDSLLKNPQFGYPLFYNEDNTFNCSYNYEIIYLPKITLNIFD